MSVVILRGDAACLPLPDESVDAVVTDPPYNLSDSGKRDAQCLRRVVAEVSFPDDDERDSQRGERGRLPVPSLGRATLRGKGGAIRVSARVSVPERPVDLQRAPVAEQEVDAGCEPAVLAPDGSLPAVGDTEGVESIGGYVLKLADGGHAPFCDSTCGCFAEPDPQAIALACVRLAKPVQPLMFRTADPAVRARALGVPKPPPVPDGQGSLFEAGEAS